MNNKIFSLLMAMAMVVAGVTLTSCSDDENEVKPSGKATEAYLTTTVYVAEPMLEYYDATCTVDGQTVTLTKDNTVAEDKTIDGLLFNLRKYTFAVKTYKSFPSTLNIEQSVKVKSGVDLKTIDRLDQFAMYTYVDFGNNNTTNYADGEWKTITGQYGNVFKKGVRFSEMTDEGRSYYQQPTLTTTITLSAADAANINAKFTYSK